MTSAVPVVERRSRARARTVAFAAVGLLALAASVAGSAWVGQRLGGALVGVGLVALAAALATWARHANPSEAAVQERHDRTPLPCIGCRDGARGRRWFVATAAAAAGAGGLGYLLTRPQGAERRLRSTAWAPGVPLVDDEGIPITTGDLEMGSVLAAWPAGAIGEGDAQVVLLRLRLDRMAVNPRHRAWAPEGYVAYSRVCTHMGCPVGLYQVDPNVLVCPCHQGAFDVYDEARPVHGPVARPLPQLPLQIGDDGVLRAAGDFVHPVGPSWWSAPG